MPPIKGHLPGRRYTCKVCDGQFVFARTQRSESGAGGKSMPLDLVPNPDGNVAVREVSTGALVARVLLKDETHDKYYEVRAMPHFATCKKAVTEDLIGGLEQLLKDHAEGAES